MRSSPSAAKAGELHGPALVRATIFNRSTYYRRTAGSRRGDLAFIFEGVGEDERIGDFGLRGGGAAGLEIDRWDPVLGSPPNGVVVATSLAHNAGDNNVARIAANVLRRFLDPAEIVISPAMERRGEDRAPNA